MPDLLLCGHGYLGQAISRNFKAAGWNVVSLSLSGGEDSLACDISSRPALEDLALQPDLVVHCASSGRGGPEAYRAVYLEGCRNLLGRFPDAPLLFTSSTSVYAQTDGSEVTEGSPAEPAQETGRILREAEDHVLSRGGIVTRLSGIYGPGRSVILKKFLAGEAALEEDGRRYLNQIDRDDAAAAILSLAEMALSRAESAQGAIYNISDSRPLSQAECYRALSELFHLPFPPSRPRDPDRKRGWTHKRVSNAKLRGTGWQPRYPCFLDAAPLIAATLGGA